MALEAKVDQLLNPSGSSTKEQNFPKPQDFSP